MEGYGRLKPFHIISTLEQYGEVPFSKPRSRADQRYTNQAMSAISAVEVRERLETRWAEEAKCMPRDSNAVAIAAVRDVSTLFKVHGSKTVRDFRKPLFGFGQHLLLALEQGKKQDDGPCLLQILRALDTKAGSTRSTMTDEAPVLDVGDLVIVRDDDEFSVVRVSRPLPPSRTSPGSLVFGHVLEEDGDNIYTYTHISQTEQTFQYKQVLSGIGGDAQLVVDRASVECLLRDGAMSVQLSEAFLDLIRAAIDAVLFL